MKLIRGLHNFVQSDRGCVLTIGNFDGVHRGHQALITRTRELAQQHSLPVVVLTFEPTPREYFSPDKLPGRLYSFRGKFEALQAQGVDQLIVQRFCHRFSLIEADAFIADLLVQRLGVKALVIGDDFRFGARREGDLALLQRRGQQHGFSVEGLGSVMVAGRRCSSTALRTALTLPDFPLAAQLLGRPYSMMGRIRRGLQLGRTLNMPTANINLIRRPALRLGIYAVRAHIGRQQWNGVASLGVRPTLGLTRCLLETHVFGEPGDLYGQVMEVEFVHYLRDELKFDSLDALAQQMQRDKAQAIDLLGD